MTRTVRPVAGLDQADLVLVAAQVLGADPQVVLDGADIAVLSGIASRVRAMVDVAEAAAEVLVGIAVGRPFAGSDPAIAWLSAVVLVERNGQTIAEDDDEWVALVQAAAEGAADERDVAAALASGLQTPPSRARRWLAAAWEPRAASPPSVPPCPACGRAVDRSALWVFSVWAVPSRIELVAVCARLHRTHDRAGVPVAVRRDDTTEPWCPVVLGPDDGGDRAFVALTEAGPLAFRPATAGSTYDVVSVGGIAASDLVGSWSTLWAHGRVVAQVPATACRLDHDRTRLDWPRFVEALAATELVSA